MIQDFQNLNFSSCNSSCSPRLLSETSFYLFQCFRLEIPHHVYQLYCPLTMLSHFSTLDTIIYYMIKILPRSSWFQLHHPQFYNRIWSLSLISALPMTVILRFSDFFIWPQLLTYSFKTIFQNQDTQPSSTQWKQQQQQPHQYKVFCQLHGEVYHSTIMFFGKWNLGSIFLEQS